MGWKELEGSQFFDRNIRPFLPAIYTNMCFSKITRRQEDNNINLLLYGEEIRFILKNTPCIQTHIIKAFKCIVCFKIGMHHTYIQTKRDLDMQWLPTLFIYSKDDIAQIVHE